VTWKTLILLVVPCVLWMGCPSGDDDDDDLAPGEGYAIGDTLPTCELTNQDGETASTHDAEGDRILVSVGAGWCEPCDEAAHEAQALYDELSAEFGFTLYEILIQTAAYSDDVPAQDLQDWADDHNFTSLDVWTDGLESCIDPFGDQGLPTFVIVDPELVIQNKYSGSYNATIEEQIKSDLQAL